MAKSKIGWTGDTWNPCVGCTKKRGVCDNCYAIENAHRMSFNPNPKISNAYRGTTRTKSNGRKEWTGVVRLLPERLLDPFHWQRSRLIFANSLSDLFHEKLSIEDVTGMCRVMQLADWHIFQVLTKRDRRLRNLLSGALRNVAGSEHIWWGVSAGTVKHGLPRIDELRAAPAAVRFLSLEPLIEDLGALDLDGIHWVIAGGESGSRARPMHANWVRSIRDQCKSANIPFFFKQWGEWLAESQIIDPALQDAVSRFGPKKTHKWPDGTLSFRVGTIKAENLLDGATFEEYPPINRSAPPTRKRKQELIDQWVAEFPALAPMALNGRKQKNSGGVAV